MGISNSARDNVRCVEGVKLFNAEIIKGHIYTIEGVRHYSTGASYILKGWPDHEFKASRFERVGRQYTDDGVEKVDEDKAREAALVQLPAPMKTCPSGLNEPVPQKISPPDRDAEFWREHNESVQRKHNPPPWGQYKFTIPPLSGYHKLEMAESILCDVRVHGYVTSCKEQAILDYRRLTGSAQ